MTPINASIRLKLATSFLLLGIAIIIVVTISSYVQMRTTLFEQVEKQGAAVTRTFSQLTTAHIFKSDFAAVLANAREIVTTGNLSAATLMDTRGVVWVTTRTGQRAVASVDPFYRSVIATQTFDYRKRSIDGAALLEFVSPIIALGDVVYLLITEIPLQSIEEQIAMNTRRIFAIALFVVLAAVFLSIILSNYFTVPIQRLVEATNEISRGNLAHKIEVLAGDEVGELTEAFNRMAGNLRSEQIERKSVEVELKSSHERFLTVLDSIAAYVYVAEMDSYRILFMNNYMRESFGADLIGTPCWKAVMGSEAPCENCAFDSLVSPEGEPIGVVTRESRNPITGKWYINHGRAVRWPGGELVRLQIATDITRLKELEKERRKIQRQLLQSQKMESMGTLAGGIAHDFNNILYPILGFTEMALDEVSPDSEAEQYMQEVLRSAERAKKLVEQILSFSRRDVEDYRSLKLEPILKEALKLARATIPATIRIVTDFSTDCGAVQGNENQLHQVAMNLFANAYNAMEQSGGVLRVKLEERVLKTRDIPVGQDSKPGRYALLTIDDSGHGMPAEIVERIFEPYYTTRQKGKGTGLGLSITHGIIKSHGGFIHVDSVPRSGTTVRVGLPLIGSKTPVAEGDDSRNAAIPGGPETILLVDDEKPVTRLVEKVLAKLGYRVHARTDSVEALALFRSNPAAYDLVITDMTMPRMTGLDLSRALLETRPDLPIILCTGFSVMVDENRARALGIRAFVMKPIMKREMAVTIRRVLDNSG